MTYRGNNWTDYVADAQPQRIQLGHSVRLLVAHNSVVIYEDVAFVQHSNIQIAQRFNVLF